MGKFRDVPIMPSSGITSADAPVWLAHGACGVGMGSQLSGKDINCADGTPEFAAAREKWITNDLPNVKALLKTLKLTV